MDPIPTFPGTSFFSCFGRRKSIKGGIRPGMTDQFQVFKLLYKSGHLRFGIPTVTQEDDLAARANRFHGLGDQFSGQGDLTFLLLPEPILHWDRRLVEFPFPIYGDGEEEANHAVTIEIVRSIVGRMVIQFGAKFKLFAGLFNHSIINRKEKGLVF